MKVEMKDDGVMHVIADNTVEHRVLSELLGEKSNVHLEIKIDERILKKMPIVLDDMDLLGSEK